VNQDPHLEIVPLELLHCAPDKVRAREERGEMSDRVNILLAQASLLAPQHIILKGREGERERVKRRCRF
jgi:hypothetical protein